MATQTTQDLLALYKELQSTTALNTWWPADSRYEIIVGAVPTQNTSWRNVETAIAQLKAAEALDPHTLLELSLPRLRELIYSAGFYRVKATYLRAATQWFLDNDADARSWDTARLRESLLSVRGIGDETADSIALYVYDRPLFIYDLYARRLLASRGFGSFPNYKAAKRALDQHLPDLSAAEFGTFHGLIVDHSKQAAGRM